MKPLFTALSLLFLITVFGQEKINKTTFFDVLGEIKTNQNITIQDLKKLPFHEIGNLIIYNHLGEKKSEQIKLKGVLLKDVLANIEFNNPNPKVLSEYYLTAVASDGYKVVYSWNELFNSPTGNSVFIITEKDSIGIDEMNESILLVTTSDFKTGRRNVKALQKIIVGRVR